MAEPWILWLLGAILVFVVLPMVAIALRYYLLSRWTENIKETVDDLLEGTRQRLRETYRALLERPGEREDT